MKNRGVKHEVTLIYIPPQSRPIRKLSFSKNSFRLYLSLLITILLSVIVWLIYVHIQSDREFFLLNQQLRTEQIENKQIVLTKNNTIEQLQTNVFDLSETAIEIEDQMNELQLLESELRKLAQDAALQLDLPSGTPTAHYEGLGGLDGPVDKTQITQLMNETAASFVHLEDELVQMNKHLSNAKATLVQIDEWQRHTPDIWPVQSTAISSDYGIRRDPFTRKLSFHNGIDLPGKRNDPVYATADGFIEDTGWDPIQGNYIHLNHRYGLLTHYLHLRKIIVRTGDQVKKGELIGHMGSTGRSTGNHLHYEVHKEGQEVNPMPYIPN